MSRGLGDVYKRQCKAVVKTDKVQQPEAERAPEYEKYYKLYTEIYPALKAEFAKLAKM